METKYASQVAPASDSSKAFGLAGLSRVLPCSWGGGGVMQENIGKTGRIF